MKQLDSKAETGERRFYDRLRLLSIDVAIGALGGGCMVAAYLQEPMRWAWYVLLPLAVWTIYTLDHLLDARRLGERASTDRHRFHVQHFTVLAILAGLSGIACLVLAVIFLRIQGIYFGLIMGGVVLVHLLLVKLVGERTSPLLIKEFGVAFVYAMGIWGLPLINSGEWKTMIGILPFVQFLLLALINLLEFSLFEIETDARDGQTSFVRALGKVKSIRLIRVLLAIVAAIGVVLLILEDSMQVVSIELILGLMAAMLALLLYRKAWFSQFERYRSWGDAAFMLPFFYLLIYLR
ncbi:MAG: hypothetical protein KA239_03890 [Bacteroidia bacterium]|nr:hypothetical protein [Bacteroidota bacterium]MBP6640215.1 hypothetical protein [Bacteroidia bacterium]MBP6721438.1 hypothetical protein [Bacteroidia bacterium]